MLAAAKRAEGETGLATAIRPAEHSLLSFLFVLTPDDYCQTRTDCIHRSGLRGADDLLVFVLCSGALSIARILIAAGFFAMR